MKNEIIVPHPGIAQRIADELRREQFDAEVEMISHDWGPPSYRVLSQQASVKHLESIELQIACDDAADD